MLIFILCLSLIKGSFFLDQTELLTNLPSLRNGDAKWYDFDNNGWLDLMICGVDVYFNKYLKYYIQINDSLFIDMSNSSFSGSPPRIFSCAIDVYDYNQDGRLDFFITGIQDSTRVAKLYQQTDINTFTDVTSLRFSSNMPPGVSSGTVNWIDINNDNYMDLIITGSNGISFDPINNLFFQIYIQNSAHNFLLAETSTYFNPVPDNIYQGIVECYDNYLVVIGVNGSTITDNIVIFYEKINNVYQQMFINHQIQGLSDGSFNWADYDNDGLVDFLITGFINADYAYMSGPITRLYKQNNQHQFIDVTSTSFTNMIEVSQSASSLKDLNNDGYLDIALIGTSVIGINQNNIYIQQSDHTFIKQDNIFSYPDGSHLGCVLPIFNVVDYNKDGRNDIFLSCIVSSSYYQHRLYRQGCLGYEYLKIYPDLCTPCKGNLSTDQLTCTECSGQSYFNGINCQECIDNSIPNFNHTNCIFCNRNQTAINGQCIDNKNSNSTNSNLSLIIGLSVSILIICIICCLLCCSIILILLMIISIVTMVIIIIVLVLISLTSTITMIFVKKRKHKLVYEDLEFTKQIGSGAFGSVCLGKYKNKTVAIKSISVLADQKALDDFMNESVILEKLDHPNIISYIGTVIGDDVAYLVLEYAENGSLDKYMYKLKYEEKLNIAYQVALGLQYLHSKGIIHRDLSCRNILLNDNLEVKITDFGLSRLLPNPMDEGQQTKNNIGPVRWLPIEFFMFKRYSKAGDIYMFGMFLYELLTCKFPYYEYDNVFDVMDAIKAGVKPTLEESWHDSIKDLLLQCWQDVEEQRPTLNDILLILKPYLLSYNKLNEDTDESTDELELNVEVVYTNV